MCTCIHEYSYSFNKQVLSGYHVSGPGNVGATLGAYECCILARGAHRIGMSEARGGVRTHCRIEVDLGTGRCNAAILTLQMETESSPVSSTRIPLPASHVPAVPNQTHQLLSQTCSCWPVLLALSGNLRIQDGQHNLQGLVQNENTEVLNKKAEFQDRDSRMYNQAWSLCKCRALLSQPAWCLPAAYSPLH